MLKDVKIQEITYYWMKTNLKINNEIVHILNIIINIYIEESFLQIKVVHKRYRTYKANQYEIINDV